MLLLPCREASKRHPTRLISSEISAALGTAGETAGLAAAFRLRGGPARCSSSHPPLLGWRRWSPRNLCVDRPVAASFEVSVWMPALDDVSRGRCRPGRGHHLPTNRSTVCVSGTATPVARARRLTTAAVHCMATALGGSARGSYCQPQTMVITERQETRQCNATMPSMGLRPRAPCRPWLRRSCARDQYGVHWSRSSGFLYKSLHRLLAFLLVAFTKRGLPVRLQMFGRKQPIKGTLVAFRCLLLFLTTPSFFICKRTDYTPYMSPSIGGLETHYHYGRTYKARVQISKASNR
nr:uncharacterized protein LOC117852917 isoform X2 [Setaria viridis]